MFLNTSRRRARDAGASPTKFNVWRRQTGAFQDVSAYRFSVVNITGGETRTGGGRACQRRFLPPVWRAVPVMGRTFTADEDLPERPLQPSSSATASGDAALAAIRASSGARMSASTGSRTRSSACSGPFDTEAIQSPAGHAGGVAAVPDRSAQQDAGAFLSVAAGRLKPGRFGRGGDGAAGAGGERISRKRSRRRCRRRSASACSRLQEIIVRNVRSSLWILVGAVELRPADCLRQRREPAARSRDRPPARDRDSLGGRRGARSHRAAAADGEPGAVDARWRARACARGHRHPSPAWR